MARIMALDYGMKRTGIAVTDPLKIIATGLTTVDTPKLMDYLKDYLQREQVERVLIGYPLNLDDTHTHATPLVEKFIETFTKLYPAMPVEKVDERFTSKMAKNAMLEMGLRKKQRRDKGLVDEIAATIMLQDHLRNHY